VFTIAVRDAKIAVATDIIFTKAI